MKGNIGNIFASLFIRKQGGKGECPMKSPAAWVLVIAGMVGLVSCSGTGTRPYQDLTADEISFATVRLQPPDKTLQVDKTDELVALLRDVVLYEKDSSYAQYNGQAVTFTLTMADGTQTRIMAYAPFLVIDGVGYRTEYEPCEALNRYANEWLDSEEAVVVLEQPPALTVISDETSAAALLGTYAWQQKKADGTFSDAEADSPHPLDCEDLLSPPLETSEATAVLKFAEEPDKIVGVQCWSDSHWSHPSADGEAVAHNGNTIELRSGGYIYEIVAQWDTDSGYGGTAHYSFYVSTA